MAAGFLKLAGKLSRLYVTLLLTILRPQREGTLRDLIARPNTVLCPQNNLQWQGEPAGPVECSKCLLATCKQTLPSAVLCGYSTV